MGMGLTHDQPPCATDKRATKQHAQTRRNPFASTTDVYAATPASGTSATLHQNNAAGRLRRIRRRIRLFWRHRARLLRWSFVWRRTRRSLTRLGRFDRRLAGLGWLDGTTRFRWRPGGIARYTRRHYLFPVRHPAHRQAASCPDVAKLLTHVMHGTLLPQPAKSISANSLTNGPVRPTPPTSDSAGHNNHEVRRRTFRSPARSVRKVDCL